MQSKNSDYHLQELSESDFEIADGQPNIKNWDVTDGSGNRIGNVEELLFDPTAQKVRYIVVSLKENVFDLEARDVLVPIGIAELHEKDDEVILPNISREQLKALPDYEKGQMGKEYENEIRSILTGIGSMGLAGAAVAGSDLGVAHEDFYEHHHFDDERLFRNRDKQAEGETIPIIEEKLEIGKREVETGGVRLRSRIAEQEVSKDVDLKEERVTVQRTPVDRPASEADLREESIEMVERAEVPVVNKEARIVEEISLNKEVNERDETIKDSVKKTEVDVEPLHTPDKKENDEAF